MDVFQPVDKFFKLTQDKDAVFDSERYVVGWRISGAKVEVDGATMELDYSYSFIAGGGWLHTKVGAFKVEVIWIHNQGYFVNVTNSEGQVQSQHYNDYDVDKLRQELGKRIEIFYRT